MGQGKPMLEIFKHKAGKGIGKVEVSMDLYSASSWTHL